MLALQSDDTPEEIKRARSFFSVMQRSWWGFAKAVHAIKSEQIYQKAGFESFRAFCEKEYSTTNYSTISKFISIVDSGWRDEIEERIQDESFQLPAYESCYMISVAAKDTEVPKEEISRVREEVLNSKIGYHSLRDRIKDILAKKRERVAHDIERSVEVFEKELERDIEGELESFDFEVDEAPQASELSALSVRADYLIDNLPEISNRVDLSHEAVELAEKLEKLQNLIEEYLMKVEELS